MIAKPEWFTRRKYLGWGLMPVTWQGWVYIAVVVLPLVLILTMDVVGTAATAFLVVWAVVFSIDLLDVMTRLPKDERDRIHEAIAERNALWAILVVLVAGVGYQAAADAVAGSTITVDPVILIALFAGVITKAISNVYLDKNN